MKYYHISKPDKKTIISILSNGLKANEDGEIFLFENKSISIFGIKNYVADQIAQNQVFLKKYSMFEIDSEGLNIEAINDNVAEVSSQYQWIARQPVIEAKHINFFGVFKTNFKQMNIEDIQKFIEEQ
jgi:hypothetical protein